jgi:hypothetical protein
MPSLAQSVAAAPSPSQRVGGAASLVHSIPPVQTSASTVHKQACFIDARLGGKAPRRKHDNYCARICPINFCGMRQRLPPHTRARESHTHALTLTLFFLEVSVSPNGGRLSAVFGYSDR